MLNETILAIRQEFEQANRILVASHIRPDGDAVSSVLAVGLGLRALGKDVQMVLGDGVPNVFRCLSGYDLISKKPIGDFDLVVVVDCGDLDRVGPVLNGFDRININIDHHPTNTLFADYNLVHPEDVSTTAVLARYYEELGLVRTSNVNQALLAGLLTDTQGFKTINVQPESLHLAGELYASGANLPELYYQLLTKKKFETVKYWGAGLSNIQMDDSVIWTTLSLEDRKATGYPGRDDADMVNMLLAVEEANVAVVFIEQDDQSVKISWRAKSSYDVSVIASYFGGGGHVAASGAMLDGPMDEVISQVIPYTLERIKK